MLRRTFFALTFLAGTVMLLQAQTYKVTGQIPIAGTGGWDYVFVDPANHRLYVTHSTQVEVIDLASEKPVATIIGFQRLHGVATADEFNRGFISDGGANEVAVFDLKSNTVLQKVKAGTNPDGILYDPATKRVFAFNGRSGDVTAINAKDSSVAGSIALGGKPEFPVSDGKGSVFANIEDKSEIVKIDPQGLKVLEHWPLQGCEEPSGLAIDTDAHRLFSVCDNQKMAVVNYDNGKVVSTVPIGDGPDAAGYDADKKLAFSSNGQSGTLTVVKQESADKYSVVSNVTTEKSARTMAIDPSTHKIYLPAAKFGPPPAATKDNPKPRPTVLPDSFHLIIVSPS